MKDNQTVRLYIAGHSGIGKSPLTRLFNVEGWEPFRVRVPRNDQDAKVCKTPEEARKLETAYRETSPIYKSPENSINQLRVYDEWSVFDVRGKSQWLNHAVAKDPNASLRIEIFAPVFAEVLENRDKIKEAFDLELDNILILLLNPTSMSFREMKEPTHALSLATLAATTERSRLYGNLVGTLLTSWTNFISESLKLQMSRYPLGARPRTPNGVLVFFNLFCFSEA